MGKKAAGRKEDGEEAQESEVPQPLLCEAEARELAQYDLLPKIAPFLDRHLIIPMLEYALNSGIYRQEDVMRAEIDVAVEAYLLYPEILERIAQKYMVLGEEVPQSCLDRQTTQLANFGRSEDTVRDMLFILEDEKKVEMIQSFKTQADMCDDFEISAEVVEELPRYAKKIFDAGKYDVALRLLKYYMNMPQSGPYYYIIQYHGSQSSAIHSPVTGMRYASKDDAEEAYQRAERRLREEFAKQEKGTPDSGKAVMWCDNEFKEEAFFAKSRDRPGEMGVWFKNEQTRKQAEDEARDRQLIWGSLAAAILSGPQDRSHAEEAAKMIMKMDEHLENSKVSKKEVLLHRTWLLNWTLFCLFRLENCDPKIVDFFLSEKSLSVISLSCPHLFRYVGACLILHKRLRHIVKETVWIIHHEAKSYSDPVTRFLLALYTEMDYDEAQRELQRCEQVCKVDYFLNVCWQEFQENARLHIFESYCRIHQSINITMLAEKLNMQAGEAELWIAKLIQNAKLDARIDSEKSRVVMTKAPPNVYQQVIEKTKNLAFRSTMLVSNLEKKD